MTEYIINPLVFLLTFIFNTFSECQIHAEYIVQMEQIFYQNALKLYAHTHDQRVRTKHNKLFVFLNLHHLRFQRFYLPYRYLYQTLMTQKAELQSQI